jgi:hypothetical protein
MSETERALRGRGERVRRLRKRGRDVGVEAGCGDGRTWGEVGAEIKREYCIFDYLFATIAIHRASLSRPRNTRKKQFNRGLTTLSTTLLGNLPQIFHSASPVLPLSDHNSPGTSNPLPGRFRPASYHFLQTSPLSRSEPMLGSRPQRIITSN